jgi:hypothetical protein
MAAARNDIGAFLRATESEIKGMRIDMKKEINRQVHGDGSSVLTLCGVTTASTTVVVNSTRFLRAGMVVDIRTMSTGAVISNGDSLTIDSIDSATTWTYTGTAVTTTAAAAVYREDSVPDATGPMEMWGLQAIISDANPGNGLSGSVDRYGQIDRSVAAGTFWQATVSYQDSSQDGAGTVTAITELFLREMLDDLEIAGADEPQLAITDHTVKRQIGDLFTSLRRYPGGKVELNNGYSGLEFDDAVIVAEVDAHEVEDPTRSAAAAAATTFNRIYWISRGNMAVEIMEDFDWMNKDGAVLSRVANTDAYEAVFKIYANISADRCNTLGLLFGVG